MDHKVKSYINKKQNISNKMGISEMIKVKYEKALSRAHTKMMKSEEALIKKDEALIKKDENTVINAYKNGISIKLIVNITNLPTKEVKAILKKNGLV